MKKSVLFFAVFFIFMSVSVLSFALEEKAPEVLEPVADSALKAGGDELEEVADGSGGGDKDMEEINQKVYAVKNPNHTQILGGKSEDANKKKSSRRVFGFERAAERSDRIEEINRPKPEDPEGVVKPDKGKGKGKNKNKDRGKKMGKNK
jgi:hypothetical protein